MADDTETAIPGRPRREPPTIDLQATETGGAQSDAAAAAPPLWRQPPAIAAAGAGALVLLGIVVWAVMPNGAGDIAPSDTADRLARLESRLRDLAARPTAAEPKGLDELTARLGRLESALASARNTSDAAVANRLAAVEAESKALANGVANLSRRADETAAALRETREQNQALAKIVGDLSRQSAGVSRADVDALASRLAAVESAAKTLGDTLAKALDGATDRGARQATAAIALKSAIDRGVAFRSELAAFKTLAGDAKLAAALEPYADTGIPGVAALMKDFAARLPEIQQTVNVTPSGSGFLGRLQANAERLVRVRPLSDAQGDEASAVAARLETRIAQSDLAGVVAEAGKLPAAARAPIEPLIAKAAARGAAIQAAERLLADALAALAQPGAPQR